MSDLYVEEKLKREKEAEEIYDDRHLCEVFDENNSLRLIHLWERWMVFKYPVVNKDLNPQQILTVIFCPYCGERLHD